jgi:hypothetical protein
MTYDILYRELSTHLLVYNIEIHTMMDQWRLKQKRTRDPLENPWYHENG